MSRWLTAVLLVALGLGRVLSAPSLPEAPRDYVTDGARVLSESVRRQLNEQLATEERESSSQIVVWIEPSLPEGASLEDYVQQLFEKWKIGQRGKNNGVLFAIFPQNRRMRIETGYGLEGALPDALAGRIISETVAPRFRSGDWEGGVTAGVQAIRAAIHGEYKADRPARSASSGRPVRWDLVIGASLLGALVGAWARGRVGTSVGRLDRLTTWLEGGFMGGVGHGAAIAAWQRMGIPAALIALFFAWGMILNRRRGTELSGRGRRDYGGWGNWGSWGGSSGGWGGGFGGGGFGGGGGRSGGGGASGGW